MAQSTRSSVLLDVAPQQHRPEDFLDKDRPFRILIAGDFSGRANRALSSPLADRRPVMVDRDNADTVLANMRAGLRLSGIEIEFSEIDHFHPDHIYRNVALFQRLEEERSRPVTAAASPAKVDPKKPGPPASSLLDQMIEETGEDPAPGPEYARDLADFVKRTVRPHLAAREDPHQQEHASRVDSTAAAAMRAVLHHPDFQGLEAAWRAVWMLVHRLDTDGRLKLFLLDATREELAGDPARMLELFENNERPWSVIAANYVFGQTDQDATMLRTFGRKARRAGVPFLAEATPPSDSSAGPLWAALRRSADAPWIGLALPRFLLRLPYGRQTSPVESFEFEEMPESVHQQYLWGNPAFCWAYLLGETFLADGWHMQPGSRRRIDGLPLHVYTEDGESQVKPCAEVLMTESEAEFLMEQGIMPLASMKEQDAVVLLGFQSIADPVATLCGPWEG